MEKCAYCDVKRQGEDEAYRQRDGDDAVCGVWAEHAWAECTPRDGGTPAKIGGNHLAHLFGDIPLFGRFPCFGYGREYCPRDIKPQGIDE